MGYKFNPFTGNFDATDSPNGEFESLDVSGDINLDDGGTYETTVQVVTPTANRTISFPNATGTVALVAGSSGQLTYNNAGAQAGDANLTWNATTGLALGKPLNVNIAGAASTPSVSFLGSWYTGGTPTTTKPKLLIEPSGTTSIGWSTSGTGIGVNAASGFGGRLLDLQLNGTSSFNVDSTGAVRVSAGSSLGGVVGTGDNGFRGLQLGGITYGANGYAAVRETGAFVIRALGSFSWSSDGNPATNATVDLHLYRDAAATLAQRNGTNAQTFRLYNTYTDASNYERGFLKWNSNVFEIGSEGAGTGSEKPVRITAATLKLPNLPTYADNAAATTGGLVAGDVYKTSTGELRITV